MRGQGRGDGHLRWFGVPRGGAAIAPLDNEDEMAVINDSFQYHQHKII